MSKIVTIIIGEEYHSPKVTLQWPEYKKLPSEYMPEVAKHIAEHDVVVIRTCSSEIVNFIGSCIEARALNRNFTSIILEGEKYTFSEKGIIEDNWPFGVLGDYDWDLWKIVNPDYIR